MYELYKLADLMVKEIKRMEKSGVDKQTIKDYKHKIINHLEESL